MEVALGYFEDDGQTEYDLSQPPMTGIDYLKRVQREAAECPDVVVAQHRPPVVAATRKKIENEKNSCKGYPNINDTDIVDKTTLSTKAVTTTNTTTTRTLNMSKSYPDEKRQARIAEEFAFLRQKFNRVKSDPALFPVSESTTLSFPKVASQQVLGRFCYGKDFVSRYMDANLKGLNAQFLNQGALDGEGTVPLLGLMLKMKQSLVLKLLNFNLKWLGVLGFSRHQGVWIHALLVCLDKPLPSEMSSTIRDLCRRILDIRNRFEGESYTEEILHQLNLIIVLITRSFGQPDLLDDILADSGLHTLCLR